MREREGIEEERKGERREKGGRKEGDKGGREWEREGVSEGEIIIESERGGLREGVGDEGKDRGREGDPYAFAPNSMFNSTKKVIDRGR